MPIELTCSCGKRLQAPDAYSGRQGQCPACGELLPIPERNETGDRVVPFSDEAAHTVFAAPESLGPKSPGAPENATVPAVGSAPALLNEQWRESGPHDTKQMTSLGCVLTLVSVAVIFCVAVPIVRWRDPVNGQPMPRVVAMITPILIGAIFQAIVTRFLGFLGLQIWKEREKDGEM